MVSLPTWLKRTRAKMPDERLDTSAHRWKDQPKRETWWTKNKERVIKLSIPIPLLLTSVVYFSPILVGLHQSLPLLAVGAILTAFLVGYVKGRASALSIFEDLSLFVAQMGDRAALLIGEVKTTENGTFLNPLKQISELGFTREFETLRDRFQRREIESVDSKAARFTETGDEETNWHIPRHHAKVESDKMGLNVFKDAYVAHVGRIEDNLKSETSDVRMTLPDVIDRRASRDISDAFREQGRDLRDEARRSNRFMEEIQQILKDDDRIANRRVDELVTFLNEVSSAFQREHSSGGDSASTDTTNIEEAAKDAADDRRK